VLADKRCAVVVFRKIAKVAHNRAHDFRRGLAGWVVTGGTQQQNRVDDAVADQVLGDLPACLIKFGCRSDQNPRTRALDQVQDMLARQVAVDRCGDARELGSQRGSDQLDAVGRDQRDGPIPLYADVAQQVCGLAHISEQLSERAARRLMPAGPVGQHGHRWAVGP